VIGQALPFLPNGNNSERYEDSDRDLDKQCAAITHGEPVRGMSTRQAIDMSELL